MPYPISYSFELDPAAADPRRILDCFEAAAREARLDVVSRGADRLVLSGSMMRALGEERYLPMALASRCEVSLSGPEGARKVRVDVRFAEFVLIGAVLPLVPVIGALILKGRAVLPEAPLTGGTCVLILWLILYLQGMLESRVWTRRRLESLT